MKINNLNSLLTDLKYLNQDEKINQLKESIINFNYDSLSKSELFDIKDYIKDIEEYITSNNSKQLKNIKIYFMCPIFALLHFIILLIDFNISSLSWLLSLLFLTKLLLIDNIIEYKNNKKIIKKQNDIINISEDKICNLLRNREQEKKEPNNIIDVQYVEIIPKDLNYYINAIKDKIELEIPLLPKEKEAEYYFKYIALVKMENNISSKNLLNGLLDLDNLIVAILNNKEYELNYGSKIRTIC